MNIQLNIIDKRLQKEYALAKKTWDRCRRCQIGEWADNHVMGRGTLPAEVLFIGEAPGENEDALGFPFVGESGHLLQTLIDDAFKHRDPITYFITNTVACIPRDDPDGRLRMPSDQEKDTCAPRVRALIQMCEPRFVVSVGKVAEKSCYETFYSAMVLKGITHRHIDHPAYLLRRGGAKSAEFTRALKVLTHIAKSLR